MMIGQKLKERYNIHDELGRGGMAIVYRAQDTILKRDVAIKVLHTHLADRPEARRRLYREAFTAAQLSHEHILKVFDFSGEEETGPAILVTEYIRGKTLKELFDGEKNFPIEVAAMIGVVLAEALEHAHQNGIVHRDVKPENIMFRTSDGVLKLMDFGIAKLTDEWNLTQTGALLGSPAHMAPELIEGKEATFQSDIYGVGIVLYLFSTGEYPFWEKTPHALLRKVAQGKFRDPEAICPAVGRRFNRIIKKAMARNPKERFADASELALALRSFLEESGIQDAESSLRRFFMAPQKESALLKTQVVEALLIHAKEAMKQRRKGMVLRYLNRVLAYEPENQAASEMLEALSQKTKHSFIALAGVLLFLLAGSVWAYQEIFSTPAPQTKVVSLFPGGLAFPQNALEKFSGLFSTSANEIALSASLPSSLPVEPTSIEAVTLPTTEKLPLQEDSSAATKEIENAVVPEETIPTLRVRSEYWTTAYVNNEAQGDAELHSLRLPRGKHTIKVEKPECVTKIYRVEVKEEGGELVVFHKENGEERSIEEIKFRCNYLPATLMIEKIPSDAEIWVYVSNDKIPIKYLDSLTPGVAGEGKSFPITIDMKDDLEIIYEVSFTTPSKSPVQYETFKKTIKFTAGEKAKVVLNMIKK